MGPGRLVMANIISNLITRGVDKREPRRLRPNTSIFHSQNPTLCVGVPRHRRRRHCSQDQADTAASQRNVENNDDLNGETNPTRIKRTNKNIIKKRNTPKNRLNVGISK